MNLREKRTLERERLKTTTCDTCGDTLIVFDTPRGAPTVWTHATYNAPFPRHPALPANENGD